MSLTEISGYKAKLDDIVNHVRSSAPVYRDRIDNFTASSEYNLKLIEEEKQVLSEIQSEEAFLKNKHQLASSYRELNDSLI